MSFLIGRNVFQRTRMTVTTISARKILQMGVSQKIHSSPWEMVRLCPNEFSMSGPMIKARIKGAAGRPMYFMTMPNRPKRIKQEKVEHGKAHPVDTDQAEQHHRGQQQAAGGSRARGRNTGSAAG